MSCPVCGKPVREKRSVFECDGGRTCDFVIFKTVASRKISVRTVKGMLKTGKSPVLKRFKSRKGKLFSAALKLSEKGRVVFDFSEVPSDNEAPSKSPPAKSRSPKRSSAPASRTPPSPVGMGCPRCNQGQIIRGRRAWGCNRWREGCRYTLAFDEDGRPRSDAEAARLLQQALTK